MDRGSVYLNAVSLHLSRTLDEVGLNTATVKRRRYTFLFGEQLHNVRDLLFNNGESNFHFGSQTEGTTIPGLKSDVDTLTCSSDFNVIQDLAEWEHDKRNMLMLQEDTAPGYCRLQLLRSDIPAVRDDVPSDECARDRRGRVVLKNTLMHKGQHLERNGPARSIQSDLDASLFDIVQALPCNSWPRQAAGFTRRHRRHGWPSKRLIEQAVTHGVFLVPVGHKLSPDEPLEWRISASLAERYLMFSLSIVHIKCYTVLKMLFKTFVEPHVENCPSSYHCKTALLYCTENTAPGFWRDDNLLQCVNACLDLLLTWLRDGFCPQFIIPEVNLFAGKVTASNKDALVSILTNLIKSNGRALLHIALDNLGQKLLTKLFTEPSRVPVLESDATACVVGEVEYYRHLDIYLIVENYLVIDQVTDPNTAIRSLYQKLVLLKERMRQSDKLERQALQAFVKFLSCLLGSLLASVSLSRRARPPPQAIRLFRVAASSDIASQLKLASVFYCGGDYRKTEAILLNLNDHFHLNEVMPICICHEKECIISLSFCHRLIALKSKVEQDRLFAHCVRFLPQEIHCVPAELRLEQLRSDENGGRQRESTQEDWMDLVAVDCLPYMFFLQYVTFRRLGKHDQQRQALFTLNQCVREDYGFNHLETVWNLLGQCMELKQEPEAAMKCYRKSLEIRPNHNAANRHLQNLRYKRIREGLP